MAAMTATFEDLVADYTLTCRALPTEFQGHLADGRFFYFRYRWGIASLGFGATLDEAVDDSEHRELEHGGEYDGTLDEDEFRAIFVRLAEF